MTAPSGFEQLTTVVTSWFEQAWEVFRGLGPVLFGHVVIEAQAVGPLRLLVLAEENGYGWEWSIQDGSGRAVHTLAGVRPTHGEAIAIGLAHLDEACMRLRARTAAS